MDDELQEGDSDMRTAFSTCLGEVGSAFGVVGCEKRMTWRNQSLSISPIMHRKYLSAIASL